MLVPSFLGGILGFRRNGVLPLDMWSDTILSVRFICHMPLYYKLKEWCEIGLNVMLMTSGFPILMSSNPLFLKRRALASIIPGRERPEETTVCYKISLVHLITNLNVILYLSTCHAAYISVLITLYVYAITNY
jgi:hypothetical protein